MPTGRSDRMSSGPARQDQRDPFQLDRDRILYSTAFRRLAGVTQVVSPGEGEVFHNRLTHTLKVAQIARRLAEMLLARPGGKELAEAWGGIDPEVVEAAALAHDLGHPPFGHVAEEELNHLVSEASPDQPEGYEGNAQSFRILTTLAVRRPGSKWGLDLTAATLAATLKYPRMWSAGAKKYGAYLSEKSPFDFARSLGTFHGEGRRSIEAQIMDWADDIAYAAHDTEDFYRAGLIPLEQLAVNPKERSYFRRKATERRASIGKPFPGGESFLNEFEGWLDSINLREPYRGARSQREALYGFISRTISTFVQGTKLVAPPGQGGEGLEIDLGYRVQVELLKELTWCYVIHNPALAAHQHGQRRAVRVLFEIFNEAAEQQNWNLFPALFREEVTELYAKGLLDAPRRLRLVADTIAAMTDQQALRMYQRLTGYAQGSVLDPILS